VDGTTGETAGAAKRDSNQPIQKKRGKREKDQASGQGNRWRIGPAVGGVLGGVAVGPNLKLTAGWVAVTGAPNGATM